MDDSVSMTDVQSGVIKRLTKPNPASPLRKEACVVSPNGAKVAYVRQVSEGGATWNQIFVADVE
jgi:ubiquitin-protein ligase